MSAKQLRFSIGACDESVVVFADPDRTKQILLNLLSNAQKFTDEGGAVSLRCEYAPHSILTIVVSDTGRGIAPDKQAEIFEPFTQLNRLQTPDAHRGIGLGLSISRTLARAMGGDLTVESEIGKGSTFRLSLPTAPPAA
jgi:signal transduction histidine kinase